MNIYIHNHVNFVLQRELGAYLVLFYCFLLNIFFPCLTFWILGQIFNQESKSFVIDSAQANVISVSVNKIYWFSNSKINELKY